MKQTLFIFIALLLQSCASSIYYQIYEVDTDLQKNKSAIVYSDDNCDVTYNLWGNAGNLTFIFTNKTDYDVCIDLQHSFVIYNGMAYDYFEDKQYTTTTSESTTYGSSVMNSFFSSTTDSESKEISKFGYTHTPNLWTPTVISKSIGHSTTSGVKGSVSISGYRTKSKSNAVTTKTERYIYIPARTSKIVRSFEISNFVYRNGKNDFDYPEKVGEKRDYNSEDTPFRFRNRIKYYINEQEFCIDNRFWVASVQNYSKAGLTEFKSVYGGTQKYSLRIESYTNIEKVYAPDKFYNEYRTKQKGLLW